MARPRGSLLFHAVRALMAEVSRYREPGSRTASYAPVGAWDWASSPAAPQASFRGFGASDLVRLLLAFCPASPSPAEAPVAVTSGTATKVFTRPAITPSHDATARSAALPCVLLGQGRL